MDVQTRNASLRAGIIGLGVGEQHIEGYARHPAATAAVACDVSAARRGEVAARHPGLEIVGDPRAVLTDPDLDVVSIASYDDHHAGQVLLALEHGKHVFVEKPLCLSPADARRIRAALERNPGLKLSRNLILRRSPRFRRVRDMVRGGDFGDVFHVEGAYDYGRLHKLTGGWRGAVEGYSVVLGGAVHLVDQLLWITGRRVVEVAAFGNGIASGAAFAGDDVVAAVLRFDDGATGAVAANFGCVRPHGHGLTVCGTRATFVNDDPWGRLYTTRDRGAEPSPVTEPHPGAAKGDLIASFIDDVLGLRDPEITVEEIFRALAVCFAIDEARRRRAVIPVEEL